MPDQEPIAEQMLKSDDATAMPWAEARRRLTEEGRTSTFWLATARSDGRPHVRPLLVVWVDGALHFTASATTRKAKNLASNSHCAVTLASNDLDIVVEGEATKVRDEGRLRRVAEAYASTYDWHVTVRDGAFQAAGGAPTAGPPPYDVYAVTPTVAFGFGTGAENWDHPTRWRFAPA